MKSKITPIAETAEEYAKRENERKGELKGYNCTLCNNRGAIAIVRDNEVIFRQCKCINIRKSLRAIKDSGIPCKYALDDFVAKEPYQKAMLELARQYISNNTSDWFYLGGAVGCGKTMVCSGLCKQLVIDKGLVARYMPWKECLSKIMYGNKDKYSDAIKPYMECELLYIDDLFKGDKLSDFAMTVGYEIINNRYANEGKITVFSSEYPISALTDIDEAIGSRIYERAKRYNLYIKPSAGRNYRTREAREV